MNIQSAPNRQSTSVPLTRRARKVVKGVGADGGWAVARLTASQRLLPQFIIIGTQKGGTSSLYEYLTQHPTILPALRKEIHYFDTANFTKGTNWYRAHFSLHLRKRYVENSTGGSVLTGEASPYYMFYPHAPRRVAELLPAVKLIVMLRNPADRALSHYYHQVRKRRESLSFEAALEAEEGRIGAERERILADEGYYSGAHAIFSYRARGLYVDQLDSWFSFFPREQFLFLDSEEFFANPAAIFKQTLRFLEVPDVELVRYGKHNAGSYSGMSAQVRSRLTRYFRPHNERLYDMLGIDFGWDH